jgi:hypothetical protein
MAKICSELCYACYSLYVIFFFLHAPWSNIRKGFDLDKYIAMTMAQDA